MLIKNHSARLITLNVSRAEKISLRPGVNDVDDAVFAKLLSDTAGKKYVETLCETPVLRRSQATPFMVLELMTETAANGTYDNLEGLSAAAAKSLIAETLHIDTLRAWAETETRSTVKKALVEQQELLTLSESDYSDGDQE